ncbi:MAG: DUF3570 domain-containing protein [Parafilimonas sp.]
MKKICLTVVGMYIMFLHAFSQFSNDTSAYKSKTLKLDEVNIISSYYSQKADKSAVMGGRTDSKGIGDVTDFANGIDLRFVKWGNDKRKNTFDGGLGIDYHTAASQAYVDSNGHARNYGTRIYPTFDWTTENESKRTSFGLGAYYSAERHFYHSLGLNTSFSKKTNHNGEFGVKLSTYLDRIKMIIPSEFSSVDSANNSSSDSIVYVTTASGHVTEIIYRNGQQIGKSKNTTPSKPRNTFTAEFSFSQVINQRMQGSIVVDLVEQNGYLGLPFHRVYFNNGKDTIENLPSQRFKLPIGLRLNYFLGDNVILRSYYRFYIDNWGLKSNTVSLEVPIKLSPFFSVSPFYRYYQQTAAKYFAPYAVHSPDDQYYTSNYALAAFTSQSFGVGLRIAPPKGILTQNLKSLEVRYAHYTQTTDLVSNVISVDLSFR